MSDIKFLAVAITAVCGTIIYLINSVGPNQNSSTSFGNIPQSQPISEFQNSRQSPEDFLRNHFELCNTGNYNKAWKNLSSQFRQRTVGDYSQFVDFWNKNSVTIKLISPSRESDTLAEYSVSLQFVENSGKLKNVNVKYTLVWDSELQQWIFI